MADAQEQATDTSPTVTDPAGASDDLELLTRFACALAALPLEADVEARAAEWLQREAGAGSPRIHAAAARVTTAVAQRRRSAAAQAAQEQRFRELADQLPLSVLEVDASGAIVYVNRHCREMWQIPEEAARTGQPALGIITPPNRGRMMASLAAVLRGETMRRVVFNSTRPDGVELVAEIDAAPVWRDGKVVGALGIAVDVTEARAAEAALRASERRFRELVELLPLAVVESDARGRLSFVNHHFTEMTGYGPEDLAAGLTLIDLVAPEERERVAASFAPGGEAVGKLRGVEFVAQRKDGNRYTVVTYSSPITVDGRVVGARGIAVDITRRKQAEEALRDSERRFRELAAMLPQVVWEVDAQGRFTFINQAGLEQLGLTEADLERGLHFTQVIDPVDHERAAADIASSLQGQTFAGSEGSVRTHDGRRLTYAIYSTPIFRDGQIVGLRGVSIDVTEQRRAEEERRKLETKLQHAQKLESLGVLAGGIAHDFNNLLVGVLGHTELALTEVRPDGPVAMRLHKVKLAAERAADLTNQMLAYAGKGRFLVRALDLSATVEEMAHLVRSGVSRHGVLTFDLHRGLPPVEADATQIRQVAMNLVINASDALGEEPGTITVSTGVTEVDPSTLADAWCAEDMPAGRCVYLQVEDSGCGMDAETRARIFDPFFTTKFAGRGLGLAAVLGIVRAHRGAIQVHSAPGQGSRFRVLLPVPEHEAESAAPPTEPHLDGWRGSGTVLLVDDEEEVREVGAAVLEGAGFRVRCAADGREGLRLLREHQTDIVAVVLDMTMPRLSGEATLRELRRLAPALPVVMVSGYGEQDLLQRVAGLGVTVALQKPFDIDGLVAKVRAALEGGTA